MVGETSSAAAAAHRRLLVQLFAPSSQSQPRRRAFLDICSEEVLNGDWSVPGVLQHYCKTTGCCSSPEATKAKVKLMVRRLLVILPPALFKRNNWLDYMRGLRPLGLIQGVHGLLSAAFRRAFQRDHGNVPEAVPRPEQVEHVLAFEEDREANVVNEGADPEATAIEKWHRERQTYLQKKFQSL